MRHAAVVLLLLLGAPLHAQSADRDGDGVLDAIDVCPSDPEDTNGFEDADGCPDEARRLNAVAARAEADASVQREAYRELASCYQAARQRTDSARGGFTSYDSAIDAWRACLPRTPRPEPIRQFVQKLTLERDDTSKARTAEERAKRRHLADDYDSKAKVQYALGGSFLVLGAGGVGTGLGFAFGQPLGRGEISNTVVGGILLGFGIIFSVETFLRFDQAHTHAKSAKSLRPVAWTPSGLQLSF